jgi:hypothetical protein
MTKKSIQEKFIGIDIGARSEKYLLVKSKGILRLIKISNMKM